MASCSGRIDGIPNLSHHFFSAILRFAHTGCMLYCHTFNVANTKMYQTIKKLAEDMKPLNVIITGATGMVGEGVLHQCLQHSDVAQVLVIGRRPCGYSHPKLSEILHQDLSDISALSARLADYNACFFCLGTTSIGKSEEEYTKQTYWLTINFAKVLAHACHEMTFCYVSGIDTDSSENGRVMWARVKGRTENDLMRLPMKQVYNLRPAGIEPFLPLRPDQTYYKMYKYLGWMFWLAKYIAPRYVVSLKDVAASMINASLYGYKSPILEVKDIKLIAARK